ncbi:Aspartate aminotransferase [Pelotomaculum sp. FP]|uniref:pyridoxal phosphate-dependent aminotransferase n=1 Tax=Pelotomaculum sp. FP TaxID=261474 RepID=UPI00106637A7|nr:pyridoxal phosphate-dependent aminotransferase [Pelotomaculum sp. FP]TEB16952.1 Aspartate aminotransferase [Pelotomaculum sp. FP]
MAISKKIESSLAGASFIRKMFEEGERLRKIHGPEKVYDFSLGNPSGEPPKAIKERLKKLALEPVQGMHRYMSNAGYADTRRAVAELLTGQTGLPFTEDHIVMTCGAGGALNVALKTLLDPGDEVIVLAPFFMEYKFYIDNHGGVLQIAHTDEDFMLDMHAIEEAITPKTKAIIINSPNNPTGVVYDAYSLAMLGNLLKAKEQETGRQIFVISDEPYAKIVYDNITVPSVFKYIKNSIIVTSHSKDLSLPGERIGYLAASPNIEEIGLFIEGAIFCNRTLGFVNAPALAQRLVTGLQGENADVAEYQEKRDILFDNLTAMGYQMVKPHGAFYLFPKSPLPDDVEFVRKAQEHNILVVPGSGFAKSGYFRISYSVDKQMILNSLPAFKALAAELGLKNS